MNSTLTNSTLTGFTMISIAPVLLIPALIITFCLTLPLNCYVIYLLLSKGRSLNVSVEFTLNLIVAEVFYSLNAPLYSLFMLSLYPWIGYLVTFNFRNTICARPLFQCCVCLEQYLAVVQPVTFLKFKPLRYRVSCSALAWLCSASLSVSTNVLNFPPYKIFSGVYLVVLAVESYCCFAVLKGLMAPGPGDRDKERRENMSSSKKKAFHIVCFNLLTLLIQNLPIAVSLSLEEVLHYFNMATIASAFINSFAGLLQPVFILYKSGKLSCCQELACAVRG